MMTFDMAMNIAARGHTNPGIDYEVYRMAAICLAQEIERLAAKRPEVARDIEEAHQSRLIKPISQGGSIIDVYSD